MNLHNISIRSRLLIAGTIILLFWSVMAFFYLDGHDRLRDQQELLDNHAALISDYAAVLTSCGASSPSGGPSATAGCAASLLQLEDRIGEFSSIQAFSEDDGAGVLLHQIFLLVEEMGRAVRSGRLESPGAANTGAASTGPATTGPATTGPATTGPASIRPATTGPATTGPASQGILSLEVYAGLLASRMAELQHTLDAMQAGYRRTGNMQLGIVLFLGILLTGTWILVFSRNMDRGFRRLITFTGQLENGSLHPSPDKPTGDEFGLITANLDQHATDLREKISYISSLANDAPRSIYSPREKDELGNALVVLSDYLTRKELEEVTRNRDDKRHNWISEGMARMGEILRSERENVPDLSFRIIQQLVTYMNVEMGSIFLTGRSDPENPTLELEAAYAYDRRKYLKKSLAWGEGLPGACAREKERIFLTEVPADYFEITSGAGSSRPNCILLVPLRLDDEVHGVIEMATVRLLKPYEIEFVESLAESIVSSLLAVRSSETTADLLRQSQAQAETMKHQETAMRENMEKLEQAQEESRRRETEFSGILQAINQSSLVAELGLNGRFASINEKFLMLLESHRDQVVGKHHSEFARVDAYSDQYKQFWSALREGQSVSNVEMYVLFSGKEVWLQQTFTPIINNEGKVYKILDIANDITENRSLQERLKTQETEIRRSSLDMQTLNEAVNASLIRCELDAEGIIMEVNENYVEVTGYGRKELLGRNYRLFLKDTEKDQFEKIWDEVKKEKVYEGVMRRSRPTGEEVWLVTTLSPVRDESGTIYKVYFLGLDITEKKLKYQLLEDANREIERLRQQLKDEGAQS